MTEKKPSPQWVIDLKAKDPDYFRKLAWKSQQKWEENGRKPRGFSLDKKRASEAGKKSRKNGGKQS